MKITFLENVRYSENGFAVLQGRAGESRNIADTAARSLMRQGKAIVGEPQDSLEDVVR
jgi:hypothetical protein